MKCSCTQENLQAGLHAVSHIAGKNINLPVLSNVLIKATTDGLQLITTNLEIAVSCNVRGIVEEAGEFTVPSRLFADYVGLLPKERVDIQVVGTTLEISCGKFKTKLHGMPASEFPLVPPVESKHQFAVQIAELRRALGNVQFAVAMNETRPEISGVCCKFAPVADGGVELTLAATDSYRLAERVVKMSVGSLEQPVQVIVPARTVGEVTRVFGGGKEGGEGSDKVEIRLGEGQIMFSAGGVEVVSRVIEGKYPDYRQLIPSAFATELIVPKDELTRAVKTTSLFSRAGLNDVTLLFSTDGTVKVRSANAQTGEHEVDLSGAIVGKENKLTVNFRYFLDGVAAMETDTISIQLNDGMGPCILRPSDGATPLAGYLYIVMPIRQ
jgi:DNA polymerase-3 subunit beta